MKIAVVILNWNGKSLLAQFLPSVVNHSENATVYVADNASTDNSVDYIKAHFPSVKIIQNAVNGGYAKGYNDALSQVQEEVYALVNSDVAVSPGWLDPVRQHFINQPQVGIIQPKILDQKAPSYFEYAGAAGGFIDKYGYPYCRGRLFSTLEEDLQQYDKPTPIFWASGACFFIRASLFHQLKGFDEAYFAHQEEIDLCWRAQNRGTQCVYLPSSVIYHVGGATLAAANPKKTYLNFRNSLLTMVKNLPKKHLRTTLLMRLVLDGVAGLKFLGSLQFSHFFAIFKAHLSFYRLLPQYLRKRRKNALKKQDYYEHSSVVWQYFVKGRKTFNSLKK